MPSGILLVIVPDALDSVDVDVDLVSFALGTALLPDDSARALRYVNRLVPITRWSMLQCISEV